MTTYSVRFCECGCGEALTGRQRMYASKACEKRARRRTATPSVAQDEVERACEFCGEPLPEGAHPNRRRHDSCRHKASRRNVDPSVGKRRQLWWKLLTMPFRRKVPILWEGAEYQLRIRHWSDLDDPLIRHLWSIWQRGCHLLRLNEQHEPDPYLPPTTRGAKEYHEPRKTSYMRTQDFELRLAAIEQSLHELVLRATEAAELLAERNPEHRQRILSTVDELLADIEHETAA